MSKSPDDKKLTNVALVRKIMGQSAYAELFVLRAIEQMADAIIAEPPKDQFIDWASLAKSAKEEITANNAR